MSGNEPQPVLLDLYKLEVTGDDSPPAGTATQVKVSFKFSEPFYTYVWLDGNWPFTVKIYAERIGGGPDYDLAQVAYNCDQPSPDYEKTIDVTLPREGVYIVSAIVELDKHMGSVMGWADQPVQITAWTPQ